MEKITAPCPYFGECGGCTSQDLAYADQLALKRARLAKLLKDMWPHDVDMTGLDEAPWRYRNKAEFTFGSGGGQVQLGFHAAGSYRRVVNVQDCLLLPEPMSRLLPMMRDAAQRSGIPVYSPRTHQGFFRFLVARASRATGKLLVCLITAPDPKGSRVATREGRTIVEGLASELAATHHDVASIYWGITAKAADTAWPEELIWLHGEQGLEEHVGPFSVHVPPLAFLQPTLVQAERLYARLSGWLVGEPDRTAWDLYCGAGLIGLYLSKHFGRVYGIDCERSNIEAGRLNAARNGRRNVEFRLGPAEDVLADKRFWLVDAKPDVIVVDPPRAGLHLSALSSVLSARPKQIAYVSCNPQALARDLAVLTASFPRYRVARLAAFDFFPHTPHLETLVLLER